MVLQAESVSFRYERTGAFVLKDVSLRVEPGQLMGLTGPSGTGKTTLARVLTGLRSADRGRVTLDGEPIRTRRGRMDGQVGLLHQSPRAATNPRMRVHDIIREPQEGAPVPNELLLRTGVTAELLDRYPGQVSDGQLQRACIARLLIAAPRYIICDEPTAMLDAAASATIAGLLQDLAKHGTGVVVTSHDHQLLEAMADTVVDVSDLASAAN